MTPLVVNKEFGLIGCNLCPDEDCDVLVHYFTTYSGDVQVVMGRVYEHFNKKHKEAGISRQYVREVLSGAFGESEGISYSDAQQKLYNSECLVYGAPKARSLHLCPIDGCYCGFTTPRKVSSLNLFFPTIFIF